MARPDPLQRKAGQSEVEWYRQMVGAANKRLERLEKYAKEDNYKAALNYAYEGAVFDVRDMNPNAKNVRFTLKLKKTQTGDVDLRDLHSKINAVQSFLEAKTSTKTGITSMYEKRAKTVNEKLGTDYTWNDLGQYFEKKKYTKSGKRTMGSDTMLKAAYIIKESGDDPKKMDEIIRSNQRFAKDKVLKRVVKDLVKQGVKSSDFFD